MGAFATQLEVALREMNFRQIDVVRKTGVVVQSQVNRYVNGGVLPELPTLEAILKIFPEPIRERLITAYLLDHIPPSGAHLVSVQPTNPEAAKPHATYGKAVQGSELADSLAYLESRALVSPPIADMIIATARALRSDALNLVLDMDDGLASEGESARVREDAAADV